MTITEVAENVKQLLWEEAAELGRSSGFIQRERELSGSSFARMLVCGALNKPELSCNDLAQYAQLAGVQISQQGIAARFTAPAAEFMKQLLERAVQHVITQQSRVAIPILAQFNGVYIRDSSVIALPASLQQLWPGVGGSAGGTAALKMQVRLNYSNGILEGPALRPGRAHDRHTPYQYDDEPAGSLSLADLAYYSLDELATRDRSGQYVIMRYKQGTLLYTENGERLPLLAWLRQLPERQAEIRVLAGEQHRLPLRLLVERVPPKVVKKRRRRIHEYARKKQVPVQEETLALAEWTLILTNAPASLLGFEAIQVLLYVRWQIELLFKLWKSMLLVDEWRSANPWRILCELYAKLIAAVISHWIFQLDWWRYPDRSLCKAAQVLRKFAVPLAITLAPQSSASLPLPTVLQMICDCICATAHVNKRRHRPATFQSLLACTVDGGLS